MLKKKSEASYSKLDNNIKSIPKDNWEAKFLLGKLSCFKYKAKISSMKISPRKTVYFILNSEQIHLWLTLHYKHLPTASSNWEKVDFLSQDSPFFK